jgi:hypothetical protein
MSGPQLLISQIHMNICPYALQSRPTRGKGKAIPFARILVSKLNQPHYIECPILFSSDGWVRQPPRRLPEEGVVVVGKSHQHFGYNTPLYKVERSWVAICGSRSLWHYP